MPLNSVAPLLTSGKRPIPHASVALWAPTHLGDHGRWHLQLVPDRPGVRTMTSPMKFLPVSVEKRSNDYGKPRTNAVKLEDRIAHLLLSHHLVSHPTLSLHAQLGDHSDYVTHLGQGHLDPLMTLGGSLPHGSLSHIIHHK